MIITSSVTESQMLTALRSFIMSILPSGISCVRGLVNRVPEPSGSDFVVMTPTLRGRLATNIDYYIDAEFTGSISGTELTISSTQYGNLSIGSNIFGVGVLPGTTITAMGTGSGGTGTYTISQSQTVSDQTIAAGIQKLLQPTKVTMQLDVHGPNSADNAQVITTLFRDAYAIEQFKTSGFDVSPLYASDPKQVPFINGEQQYEERWTIDAIMQANPVMQVPQQFASSAVVNISIPQQ